MDRARMTRNYVNRTAGFNEEDNRALELMGFLAVFHPEMSDDRRHEVLRATKGPKS